MTLPLLAALALAAPPPPVPLHFPLADLGGAVRELHQNDHALVRAFVFLGTECPVSNGAARTLNELHAALPAGAELFGVVSDPSVSRAAAKKHAADFALAFPVLFDASGLLASVLKPTHVPEAFVLDASNRVVYRGAVDNAWEAIGRRRPKAEKHTLADAIRAAVAGKPPEVASTPPVGCLFESAPAARPVTFRRDVEPILQSRCLTCHRDGQAAPFALNTYAQAAKRAGQIARVCDERVMPPWVPAPGHGPFVGERWLTDGELAILRKWAETGRAEGDPADAAPPPAFAEGWRLGTPDLVVRMPEPFRVPADGPDILQNFVLPVPVPDDKLVAAIEFHPGNPRVAHHAVLFLDGSGAARKLDAATPEPGYANFGGPGFLPSGALGGWSVGNTPRRLPDGMGRYLKKGWDLVVQMHYHPTSKPEVDRSEVGLFFVPKPAAEVAKEPGKLVGSFWVADYGIDIPAGAADYRRAATYTLPKPVTLIGVVPHLHLLGKAMHVTAKLPDGTSRPLIGIDRWNYNWQDEYYFQRSVRLPAGTVLEVAAAWDNSADNPSNPSSPPKRVTWGDGTTDEMMFCFFLATAEKPAELIHVILDNLGADGKRPRLGAKE